MITSHMLSDIFCCNNLNILISFLTHLCSIHLVLLNKQVYYNKVSVYQWVKKQGQLDLSRNQANQIVLTKKDRSLHQETIIEISDNCILQVGLEPQMNWFFLFGNVIIFCSIVEKRDKTFCVKFYYQKILKYIPVESRMEMNFYRV